MRRSQPAIVTCPCCGQRQRLFRGRLQRHDWQLPAELALDPADVGRFATCQASGFAPGAWTASKARYDRIANAMATILGVRL